MKLHELPKWVPPAPTKADRRAAPHGDNEAFRGSVIVEEMDDEDEVVELDTDEALVAACKLLRSIYRMFSHIMMQDSIYHVLNHMEQEQMVEKALEIYQFVQEWDEDNGDVEESEPGATDFDFIDMNG